MRKQSRPNQTARKQMQNLTVELFSRDMNTRRQLLDEALSLPLTTPPTSPTSPATAPVSPSSELTPKTEEQPQSQKEQETNIEPPVEEPSEKVAESREEREVVIDPVASEPTSEDPEPSCEVPVQSIQDPSPQTVCNPEVPEATNPVPKGVEKEAPIDETPPPLQRVPFAPEPCHLATIRAAAASMNIAAIPSQTEPMSFAACVRKMPSIETMSLSPSPYAKFDGKSNPFATGGGGSSGGGFSKPAPLQGNPFANRKRFDFDSPEFNSIGSSRFTDREHRHSENRSESFSSMKNGGSVRGAPRCNDNLLHNWWKSRSFSSASSHYPQSHRIGRSFSPSKNVTTLNVPTHGHVEDLDGLLTTASTQSSTTYYSSRRSDLHLKKERWARMKAKKRQLRRPVEDEFYEDPDIDEEILRGNGVMLNHIVQQNNTGNYEDADLLRKFRRDVSYVKEHVLNAIEGNIDGIRDFRFLLASVQTYGNIDGECMMAELALNEFSLFSGIVEKFHSIVGPWQTESEAHRRRASRHAFETHRIPLQNNLATITKRKLVEEILGRTEPSIACHQGVKVGLYSDSCDERTRVELNIKNNFKDPGMLCDKNDRRFILVLQSEIDLMVESMKHLAKTVGLKYEGFPVHRNRFVIVEAFVEAIADIMGEKVDVETMRWFSLLGQKVDTTDTASPWESGTDFYCARHTEPKCNFCAAVTVGRTCTIVYHVLGTFFRRYHLKKIPTASMIASRQCDRFHRT